MTDPKPNHPMHVINPSAADKLLREEILALVRRHLIPNTAERILAVSSQVVGQVLALQNPVTLGKDAAIAVIMANIEKGNQDYVTQLVQADMVRTGQTRSI